MPPVYLRILDDASTFAIQATVPIDGDPQAELAKLNASFEESLTTKLGPIDTIQASNLVSMMFADAPDAMLAQNLYGAAFGTARQYQMGIDLNALKKAIAKVKYADLQQLAKTIFAEESKVSVIIKVE